MKAALRGSGFKTVSDGLKKEALIYNWIGFKGKLYHNYCI